jgi:hypothetical protein
MEITETKKPLTQKEIRVAKLIADTEAKLKQDIADIENEEDANEERRLLENKINGLIKDFEVKYKVKYKIDTTTSVDKPTTKLSIEDKYKLLDNDVVGAKLVDNELVGGTLRYKLSDDGLGIVGLNGEKVTSILKFNDVNGKKQTLGASNYYKYLKPETTTEELKKLFPNIVRKKK